MESKHKEQLKMAVTRLIDVIDENPCGMGMAMYHALTILVSEYVKYVRRKRYLSTEEAATLLGISKRTLRRRVAEGKIPRPKHYGHWEVSYKLEDIEPFIDEKKCGHHLGT